MAAGRTRSGTAVLKIRNTVEFPVNARELFHGYAI